MAVEVANLVINHMGQQRTFKQLAHETGIPIMTLYQRWHRGDVGSRLIRPLRRYVKRERRAFSAKADSSG